jgi:dTDP-4-amino-4,6-dideoxygalactose transaminase
VTCESTQQRSKIIAALKANHIHAVFHYLSLHKSPYYSSKHDHRELPNSDRYSETLLRLPMFYELPEAIVEKTIKILLTTSGNSKS